MQAESEARDARDLVDVANLDTGTSLLVSGPAMTGKRSLVLSMLAQGTPTDRGTVIVTTRRDAATTTRDFEAYAGPEAVENLTIVDCVSRSSGFRRLDERDDRRYVSGPGDLTGVGIGATEFMRRFYHRDVPAYVGLHSISTMLMYADLRRVFQFLHVLTTRIASSDFVGVFAVDSNATPEHEQNILQQPFDALVEMRDNEGAREIRCRGADVGPRTWTPVRMR